MNCIDTTLCEADDLDKINNLLNHYKLVTQDIDLNKQVYVKLVADNEIVAIGGLELHLPYGLLRSIAVKPGHSKKGYANQICEKLEQLALAANVTELYLLTETAELFFAHRGFETLKRDNVPNVIKLTPQFSSLCPDSAAVMHKQIATPLV